VVSSTSHHRTRAARHRARASALAGIGALAAALLAAPATPAAAAPEDAAPPAGGAQRSSAQVRLVDAATAVRSAVERSGSDGLASIVLEEDGVAVYWKDGAPALPAPVAAAIEEAGRTAPVRVATAAHSIAELRTASATLEKQLATQGRFHGIKAKPDGSGLIVAMEAGGPTTLAGLPDVGVPTTVSTEPRMRPVSRDNDTSPWSGGAQIINTSIGAGCTAGFGVDTPSGPAILTAGHCGNPGNRFNDGRGEFIGAAGGVDKNFDVMVIPTNAISDKIYVGGNNSTEQRTVTDAGAPFVGEKLCQSGRTSANAVGSPICNMQVLFEHTDSQRLWEARQLDGQTAARPGDSGGPVYFDRGDGTVIARGTSTRVAGSLFGFGGWEKSEQLFKVTLPGGGSTPPPAPTGGVVFYEDVRFAGAAGQPLSVGRHPLAALEAKGLQNDWASSVRVPAGRTVTLFEHHDFTGTQWRLTADTADLTQLQPGANDTISSVVVE
jgi:V8-like Glu-specific endopeptidase